MNEQRIAQQQQAVNTIYTHAAEQMRRGRSSQQVENDLVLRGLPREAAHIVVTKLQRAQQLARRQHVIAAVGLGALGTVVNLALFAGVENGLPYMIGYSMLLAGGLYWIGTSQ